MHKSSACTLYAYMHMELNLSYNIMLESKDIKFNLDGY